MIAIIIGATFMIIWLKSLRNEEYRKMLPLLGEIG